MGRSPCCDETGLKKGPWTAEEDEKLTKYIQKHGYSSWRALPKLAGLNRCGKSCRLRWTNYLRPDIKRGKFSPEEEQTILNLHSVLGNKWSTIATHLPGRTDNEIKNFWNTHLKKKLIHMGFDPMTHRPRTDIFSSLPHLIALANLKELMEQNSWEKQAVRLQTEAEQMAKLQYLQYLLQPPSSSISSLSTNLSTIIPEMEAYNILNSIPAMKDNPVLLSTNPVETPIIPSSIMASNIPFSHLPDLETPCSFQTTINKDHDHNMLLQASNSTVLCSQGEANSPVLPWLPPSNSSPSPLLPPSVIPPMTDVSVINAGDTCSTSSSSFEGGPSSIWPELLLDDPLFERNNVERFMQPIQWE